MLLCGIITELVENNVADYDVCYFFCQAADASLNNATSVLRGLVHLLVRQQPVLMAFVHNHFDATGRQMFEGANAWSRTKDTFNRMLAYTGLKKTYIIIDALDECLCQQAELIDWVIERSQDCTQVKWLVSSRNWPPIVEALETSKGNVVVSLELNAKSVSAAVDAYIRHKVELLAQRKRYSNFTRAAVQQYLMLKADHTFLWVALVCQHLDKTRLASNELREKLPNLFPQGLDKLYARMLDMITEDDIDNIASQCISILAVMAVSYEPLALGELITLIQPSQDYHGDTGVIESRVLYCGTFLALKNETVYFVHQSAQDYLVKDGRKQIIPLGPEEEHYRLYLRSLDALEKVLDRNMYKVPSNDVACLIENIARPEPDPLNPVKHSIAHWIDHFLDSISPSRPERAAKHLSEGGRIYMFLSGKYLFWLEALSFQSNVYGGLTAMRKLEEFAKGLKDKGGIKSHELIWDFQKFLQMHSILISKMPLQLYTSALIFSPSESISRRVFAEHEPVIVPKKLPVSMCFSADSEVVVFAGKTGEILFYRTDTAALTYSTRLLDDPGLLLKSLAMSPNTHWFVCETIPDGPGAVNGELRIWSTSEKDQGRSLPSHGRVLTIAIDSKATNHSSLVAVAWADGSFKVFQSDLSELRSFQTGCKILACAFSPALDLLAVSEDTDCQYSADSSYSEDLHYSDDGNDHSIRVYDVFKGVIVRRLDGLMAPASSIAFADSSLLASASWTDIVIWNVDDATKAWTEQSNKGIIGTIAVSRSIFWVAVYKSDRICLAKLDDLQHRGTVGSTSREPINYTEARIFVFSPDSKWLASTIRDEGSPVKVWSTLSGEVEKMFHTSDIPCLAFSPDSSFVAYSLLLPHGDNGVVFSVTSLFAIGSSTLEETLSIWDCAEWKHKITILTDMDLIGSMSFSPDSSQLAVVHSRSTTVELWDTSNGSMLVQFLGDAAEIKPLGLAMTEKRIVIGLDSAVEGNNGTLLVFDKETGTRISTGLLGPTIQSVAISPNSEWIAVRSGCPPFFSNTLRLVKAQNGEVTREWAAEGLPLNLQFISNEILWTGHGEINLERSTSNSIVWLTRSVYGLENKLDETKWITKHEKKWLCLPSELKPISWISKDSIIAIEIGNTGELMFLSEGNKP
ncbi:hypothetical protein F5Y08DRAFT_352659 [Xylaria arbuscula]|nr:hypothetical protein F5Y08DRAFT_352659 [Xylaria arbuscula]